MNLTTNRWEILRLLVNGPQDDEIGPGRLTPSLFAHYADRDKGNVRNDLIWLLEHGLIRRVGPDNIKAGVYSATNAGAVVIQNREEIARMLNPDPEDDIDQFRSPEAIIEEHLGEDQWDGYWTPNED